MSSRWSHLVQRAIVALWAALIMAGLGGCALSPDPQPHLEPVVVDIEPVAPILASTERPVAIIASNLDRQAELVRVLTGQLNRDALVIDLASSPPGWTGEHLEGQGITTVVAIGQLALAAAVRVPNGEVIVAQVFDAVVGWKEEFKSLGVLDKDILRFRGIDSHLQNLQG